MPYVRLGSTGLEISRLILGCGNFGGIGSAPAFWGRGDDERTARALMDRAWDAGINVFDTADAYGGGASETFIGRWLADRGAAVRDRAVVSSKVFNPVADGPNRRGLSRKHIAQQIDASLRRLQTDRLDMYLIHEPDHATPIDETLDAMTDLIRAGKVLHVGASNVSAAFVARALGVSRAGGRAQFQWVQNGYNLLDRDAEREVLPLCAAEGLGFTPFSPLAGGWLTGKYREGAAYPDGSRMTLRPEPYLALANPRVFRALDDFAALARARGLAMSTLAIAWLLHQPGVNAVVIGPRTIAQLDDAVAAMAVALDTNEVDTIRHTLARDLGPGT